MTTEQKTYAENNPAVWAGVQAPDGMILGWKVVRPDGRTHDNYQWPLTATDVQADPNGRAFELGDACPSFPGDGLCIATSWEGAQSGGLPAITGLAVAYREADKLGGDSTKIRVKGCRVLDVLDIPRLLREGHGTGAYLTGAYLTRADLTRANLTGANLTGANLTGADLTRANLTRANLTRANLTDANLTDANLTRADLTRANLTRADLTYAIGYTPELNS
jgi:hypothetical protein